MAPKRSGKPDAAAAAKKAPVALAARLEAQAAHQLSTARQAVPVTAVLESALNVLRRREAPGTAPVDDVEHAASTADVTEPVVLQSCEDAFDVLGAAVSMYRQALSPCASAIAEAVLPYLMTAPPTALHAWRLCEQLGAAVPAAAAQVLVELIEHHAAALGALRDDEARRAAVASGTSGAVQTRVSASASAEAERCVIDVYFPLVADTRDGSDYAATTALRAMHSLVLGGMPLLPAPRRRQLAEVIAALLETVAAGVLEQNVFFSFHSQTAARAAAASVAAGKAGPIADRHMSLCGLRCLLELATAVLLHLRPVASEPLLRAAREVFGALTAVNGLRPQRDADTAAVVAKRLSDMTAAAAILALPAAARKQLPTKKSAATIAAEVEAATMLAASRHADDASLLAALRAEEREVCEVLVAARLMMAAASAAVHPRSMPTLRPISEDQSVPAPQPLVFSRLFAAAAPAAFAAPAATAAAGAASPLVMQPSFTAAAATAAPSPAVGASHHAPPVVPFSVAAVAMKSPTSAASVVAAQMQAAPTLMARVGSMPAAASSFFASRNASRETSVADAAADRFLEPSPMPEWAPSAAAAGAGATLPFGLGGATRSRSISRVTTEPSIAPPAPYVPREDGERSRSVSRVDSAATLPSGAPHMPATPLVMPAGGFGFSTSSPSPAGAAGVAAISRAATDSTSAPAANASAQYTAGARRDRASPSPAQPPLPAPRGADMNDDDAGEIVF